MKTYGVLLAGLLFATGAIADNATEQADNSLTLAANQTAQAINVKSEQDLADNELKVIDVDFTDKTDAIADKLSAKINEKFNEKMQQELSL
ncbi:hypothetical protein [uncultured Gilvimarinus sp.]|uniref:hypothetical protein n=1 Tax=uncultured Gilvimarinus sp. TaxID=1689143 RepID=UPI0030EE7A30|tara:strand:- start:945 stop:1217 length:273 start_codon:yes stop_codon:yes gene_type:complete